MADNLSAIYNDNNIPQDVVQLAQQAKEERSKHMAARNINFAANNNGSGTIDFSKDKNRQSYYYSWLLIMKISEHAEDINNEYYKSTKQRAGADQIRDSFVSYATSVKRALSNKVMWWSFSSSLLPYPAESHFWNTNQEYKDMKAYANGFDTSRLFKTATEKNYDKMNTDFSKMYDSNKIGTDPDFAVDSLEKFIVKGTNNGGAFISNEYRDNVNKLLNIIAETLNRYNKNNQDMSLYTCKFIVRAENQSTGKVRDWLRNTCGLDADKYDKLYQYAVNLAKSTSNEKPIDAVDVDKYDTSGNNFGWTPAGQRG